MRAIKWTIPFAGRYCVYNLNIYDENYEGQPIILKGADEPFVTDEDKEDDPFLAVRASSGHINIIVEDADDIDGIFPQSITDRYVELTGNNNNVLWMGYIQREVFSSAWDATPYQLQLPVISAIEVLKDIEYDVSVKTTKLCELIHDCVERTGAGFLTIYLPSRLESADLKQTITNLAFLNRETKERVYAIGSDVPEPELQITWYDVLSEVCKYFGVQLREYKNSIILSASDAGNTYHFLSLSNFNTGNVSSSDVRTFGNVALPSVGGNDGNVSHLLPMQQVRISTPLDKINEETITISDLNTLEWRETSEKETGYAYYKSEILVKDAKIITHQYTHVGSSMSEWHGAEKDVVAESWGAASFAAMPFLGATAANNTFSKNGELQQSIMLSSSFMQDGTHEYPAIEVESQQYVGSDAVDELQFIMEKQFIGYDDKVLSEGGNATVYIVVEFKPAGGGASQYFNGTSWVSTKAYVNYYFTPIADVAVGVVFPSHSGVGKYKITLCCFKRSNIDTVKYIRVTGFTLKMIANEVQMNIEHRYTLDSIERVELTGAGGMEMYSQEANLFTNADLLTKYPDYKVRSTYCGIGGNSHWQGILQRMKTWYSVVRECVETKVRPSGTILNPVTRLTFDGNVYLVGGQSINWRDDINKIKIYKL